MARLTANHDKLYFDQLVRTQKGEAVLSLIHATYQAKKNAKPGDDVKADIAKRLESAYNLFKKDAGTYTGDLKQFSSQYTIGHELCIWRNSDLDLTSLALKVAENYITVRDYFDIAFLNYFQPVNGNIVHILYHLLSYMNKNGMTAISKEKMGEVYKSVGHATEEGNVNGAYNMLIASSYFKPDSSGKELVYIAKCSMEELLSRCDTTYVEKGYEVAQTELGTEAAYIKYLLDDHRILENTEENDVVNKTRITGGKNVLYYGVPGAGKSHAIKQICDDERYLQRVVFHPDYTYSDFVGQIMPRLKVDEDTGEKKLQYTFVDGPFTKALKAAEKDPGNMHYLVIEEINRGNAPAIFGEIFQLLDRDDDGRSEYSIVNYDIAESVFKDIEARIYIPSNLTLLATMNTSDQNVFTLDTAFQRRWNMKLIPNDVEHAEHADKLIEGTNVTWGEFALTVNDAIIRINQEMSSSEDKRLGAYFVGVDDLGEDKFPEKAIKYLWDDAFKMDRDQVFGDKMDSLETVIRVYHETDDDKLAAVLRAGLYAKMIHDSNEKSKDYQEEE